MHLCMWPAQPARAATVGVQPSNCTGKCASLLRAEKTSQVACGRTRPSVAESKHAAAMRRCRGTLCEAMARSLAGRPTIMNWRTLTLTTLKRGNTVVVRHQRDCLMYGPPSSPPTNRFKQQRPMSDSPSQP